MSKNIWMGENYLSEDNELVKTIARAQSIKDGSSLVVCAIIGENGEAKNTIAMDEDDFRAKFLRESAY